MERAQDADEERALEFAIEHNLPLVCHSCREFLLFCTCGAERERELANLKRKMAIIDRELDNLEFELAFLERELNGREPLIPCTDCGED